MENLPKDKKIILFDGVCLMCNSTVIFIIKHDKKDVFRFVALQSELGEKIVKHIGLDTNLKTFILYEPGIAYYTKAEAAFKIAKELNGIISLISVFSVFPKLLQNFWYDLLSKNRYKWFGKTESCMVPTPEISNKFL